MKFKREINKNSKLFIIIGTFVIVLYILMIFVPTIWGMAQTFKSRFNWMEDRLGFPAKWTTDNFITVFKSFYITVIKNGIPSDVYIGQMVFNTILYAAGCCLTSFIVKFITAYALYKYRIFRLSGVIFSIILISINLPLEGSTAASLKLYHQLGLYDNMAGMWFLKANALGFFFLVLHSAFYAIPEAIFEAAEIDGASRFQMMVRIALPLIKGTVTLFFLTEFINVWNNYMDVLMYMPSYPTVGYGLYIFSQKTNPPEMAHTTVQLAGAFICALPMIGVLVFFGNKLMANVSIGEGVKG